MKKHSFIHELPNSNSNINEAPAAEDEFENKCKNRKNIPALLFRREQFSALYKFIKFVNEIGLSYKTERQKKNSAVYNSESESHLESGFGVPHRSLLYRLD